MIQQGIEQAKKDIAADPTAWGPFITLSVNMYLYSMLVLEENTLENAKRLGYLDVHELYPDIPPYPFAKFAEEFYYLPNPGEEFNAYM